MFPTLSASDKYATCFLSWCRQDLSDLSERNCNGGLETGFMDVGGNQREV